MTLLPPFLQTVNSLLVLRIYSNIQEDGIHSIQTSYVLLSGGIPWNIARVTCIFCIHTRLRRYCIREHYITTLSDA